MLPNALDERRELVRFQGCTEPRHALLLWLCLKLIGIQAFRAALEEIQIEPDRVVKIMTLLEGTRDAVLGRARREDA